MSQCAVPESAAALANDPSVFTLINPELVLAEWLLINHEADKFTDFGDCSIEAGIVGAFELQETGDNRVQETGDSRVQETGDR